MEPPVCGDLVTGPVVVQLPTELVARYRAVDRELVPSAICNTPEHLEALTESIREHGIQVPLRLGFNASFGFLDGNHRIAAALRLGLPEVPVELVRERPAIRRDHGQPMRREDLVVILAAFLGQSGRPTSSSGGAPGR
jgi:hypothetical protein